MAHYVNRTGTRYSCGDMDDNLHPGQHVTSAWGQMEDVKGGSTKRPWPEAKGSRSFPGLVLHTNASNCPLPQPHQRYFLSSVLCTSASARAGFTDHLPGLANTPCELKTALSLLLGNVWLSSGHRAALV